MIRYFRNTETGQWYEGSKERVGTFIRDGRQHAEAIAEAQGWPAGSVEAVDVADGLADPRSGELFTSPPTEPEPPSRAEVFTEELRAATTIAELKAALLGHFGG